jgi:hypothetical protein
VPEDRASERLSLELLWSMRPSTAVDMPDRHSRGDQAQLGDQVIGRDAFPFMTKDQMCPFMGDDLLLVESPGIALVEDPIAIFLDLDEAGDDIVPAGLLSYRPGLEDDRPPALLGEGVTEDLFIEGCGDREVANQALAVAAELPRGDGVVVRVTALLGTRIARGVAHESGSSGSLR